MAIPRLARFLGRVTNVLAAVSIAGCGGGGSSPSPVAPAPDTPPGATRVTGSERLAWTQPHAHDLQYMLYVDGSPVRLDAASCNGQADAECSSPLPPLTDGLHTLSLASVSPASGLESPRSDAITVFKVSSTRSTVSVASLPDAAPAWAAGTEPLVTAPDGRTFAVDVVARELSGHLQLAATPDGRVLAAGADGRVHVVRPGQGPVPTPALDARAWFGPAVVSQPGLAVHPDFAQNQFVYVTFIEEHGAGARRLRVVRLREAGDTLGEPATVFDTPLAADEPVRLPFATSRDAEARSAFAAPSMAFGPDDLLYLLLPAGLQAAGEAAASRPHASMLRLTADGRAPEVGGLSQIASRPLGFAWHPGTPVLMGLMAGGDGEAVVRDLSRSPAGGDGSAPLAFRMDGGSNPSLVMTEGGLSASALALAAELPPDASGSVRLSAPIRIDGLLPGISGRVTDAVAERGVWYLAVVDDGPADARGGEISSRIVRLRPR